MREPITVATDVLLAVVGILCAQWLLRISIPSRRIAMRLWGVTLLSMSLAALTGGVTHGFAHVLNPGAARILWTLTLYLVGLASASMLAATARATLDDPFRRAVIVFAWLKLLVFLWWITGHPDYRYVIYDYAPAMLLVLVFQAWGAYRRGEPSAPWISAGVLVSFAAAGIQMFGFDLHRYFNHNDMYHLVQIVAVILFYQGARRIRPR